MSVGKGKMRGEEGEGGGGYVWLVSTFASMCTG